MDRRDFLRGAGLVAGGAVSGSLATRVATGRVVPRGEVADRAQAHVPWGDPALAATRVIWKVETTDKLIALTFDDGPRPRNTTAVLDVLREYRTRATFNLVGRNALEYPDLVRREIAERHEVQNHSWSHRDLAFTPREEAEFQVRRGAEVIEQLTRTRPGFFRPPRGDVSGVSLASAARAGQDVLLWSLQLHEATYDADGNARYVAENVTPGTILLAHDTGSADRVVGLRALPKLITEVRALGYEFVTVSELVAAGSPVPPPEPARA